ncbi:hypothetical protein AB0E75_12730 [Streptomyces griseoviridis]|uniref:Uncharacterized protein n=2 Tax=Streptomyces griseoviridis TaxID=45398 RepID=A0A918GIP5_STRGD|nr:MULTISPECIES: hypothetical protein [Streptomyces]MDP9682797.1 hypothetical protein [Streptomyces griseoviridis]GGS38562.1 hypothetical protein GCM10010238_30070 [Streptomyces niveoruber]GGS91651.1 hypothetical protein GCM10010240_26390 [Streptomyces griseoviridis]
MAESPGGSRTRRARCPRAARVLVLLLALFVPGAHAQASVPPSAPIAADAGSGGTAAEYDLLDTAPRVPARATRRPCAPRRPAPPPGVRHRPAAVVPPSAPSWPFPPARPPVPRCVVLRC